MHPRRADAGEVERGEVAAAEADDPDREDVDEQRHGRDAVGAQDERGDRLRRVGDVEERHPREQRQRRGDDHRIGGVEADHLLAQQVDRAADDGGDGDADLEAGPADPARVGARRRRRCCCATSVLAALAIASGSMNIIETMLAAIWWPATAVAPMRETKNAMKVKPVTSTSTARPDRHAEAKQRRAGWPRVGACERHAAAEAEAAIERVAAQEPRTRRRAGTT